MFDEYKMKIRHEASRIYTGQKQKISVLITKIKKNLKNDVEKDSVDEEKIQGTNPEKDSVDEEKIQEKNPEKDSVDEEKIQEKNLEKDSVDEEKIQGTNPEKSKVDEINIEEVNTGETKAGKRRYVGETVLAALVLGLAGLISRLIGWMFKTWNHLSMDELMYQLHAPIEGTNQDMIQEAVFYCAPFIIIGILLAIGIGVWANKKEWKHWALGATIGVGVLIITGTVWYAWDRLDIRTYIENQNTDSAFIDQHYVFPDSVEITFPEQKRNLIYIFLESMETTYTSKRNGGGFQTDYMKELTQLAVNNEDFSGDTEELNGAYSMPSTTWTVAGMFAHSAGLPLTIPIEDNSMDTQASFFPDVVAIGDILEREGYSQTLLIGSEAVFGGRKLMYENHGDFIFHDYTYAKETGMIPPDYRVWWGYEDARLFEFAKEELKTLAAKDQPFNLTMLTVDTHFEDGYVCPDCKNTYKNNQYANVIACSSRKIGEFIEWIQAQDFYENTTIVIAGDHPTMDTDFCENVDSEYVRKVYTTYINSAVQPADTKNRRNFTTFDLFPTTVASLGAQIEGNKLGLGTNLFSDSMTLTELYGIEEMEREMQRQSELMDNFASGIVETEENRKPEKEEEVVGPSAMTYVMPYDNTTGILGVEIKEFQNVKNPIQAINLAVWIEPDQSDLQWLQATPLEDGTYKADIDVSGFNFKVGDYQIAVFLVDDLGNQYQIGATSGYVE